MVPQLVLSQCNLAGQGRFTVSALVLPLAAGAHAVRVPLVRVEVGPDGEGLQAHLALERCRILELKFQMFITFLIKSLVNRVVEDKIIEMCHSPN